MTSVDLSPPAATLDAAPASDTSDVCPRALRAACERLGACVEAMHAAEEGDEDVASPACAPFCGCDTCVIRECLDAAWPHIERVFAGGNSSLAPLNADRDPGADLQAALEAAWYGLMDEEEDLDWPEDEPWEMTQARSVLELAWPLIPTLFCAA